MLAPPPRPPRPPGYPRPRYRPGWPFTDEEWKKLAQLLYKGGLTPKDGGYILYRIQEAVAWHHRAEIERRERANLPQREVVSRRKLKIYRQWAREDPRFFEEFFGFFPEVEPQKRGPKSHDRDFVDRVIRSLVGHFPIRRGKELENFLSKLCEIAGIRRPSIDRAIREAARYLRS